MSSTILSFVGNQDPFGKDNNEGSIVTLTHHLLKENIEIIRIILLYTQDTQDGAISTKEWLLNELTKLKIPQENIELILVNDKLSKDPIDLLLAIKETRQALERPKSSLKPDDYLELNASSGTPAMKSAWSILQAAGYAPQSRVWQVRNPKTKLPDQSRVFEVNVDILRREFDLKIIKQQVEQYDYNGALISFEASNLVDNGIGTLLKYGSYRLACAFKDAWPLISEFRNIIGNQLYQQSKDLADQKHQAIVIEIYWQAVIALHNKQYSNCLIKIFAFEESIMRLIIKQKLLPLEKINIPWRNLEGNIKQAVNKYDDGALKNYLIDNRFTLDKQFNCPMMMAIIEYLYSNQSQLFKSLKELDDFREKRNDYIHQLKGISELDNPDKIIRNMQNILKSLNLVHKPNPFDTLNQKIILGFYSLAVAIAFSFPSPPATMYNS